MRIDHGDLERLVRDIYVAKGVPAAEAAVVAGYQVEANLVGHDSHGVIKTADYLKAIGKGHIVPGAQLEILNEGPCTAVIDGHWGFGFVVTEQAMRLAIDKAAEFGVAAVTVRRQGHIGRLGAYASMAADRGMIGMVTADSGLGPKAAAPYGGRERRLGTNPISIAVPTDLDGTVCIDMATTSVASGKLNVARTRGEKIPMGWILDSEGRQTDDPNDYYSGGSLQPLGGDQGHKGYGLSFMVEMFSGILTGLGFGIDPQGRHNDGCFIAVFDVNRFRPQDSFKADMGDFVDYLKATEPAAGFSEVLYPGEMELRRSRENRSRGIEIESATWEVLERIARESGVSVPRPVEPVQS